MKTIIIVLFTFMLTSATVFISVKESIQEVTIVEQIYNRLEVSKRLPYFTNRYIDRQAKNRPEVPANVWETIKTSLDYSVFKNKAIHVLKNNFTNVEMQQMIKEYESKAYIPILHFKLREELQLSLLESNSDLLNQINNILVSNNYQAIN